MKIGKIQTDEDRILEQLKRLCTETGNEEWCEIIDEHEKTLKKAMKSAVNQTKKGRKVFQKRDFMEDRITSDAAIFGYFRGQDFSDLEWELLSYRKSRMLLDPTFLPFYIDQGIKQILWFGVRINNKTNRLEVVHAIDTPATLAHYIANNPGEEE
jgi:hypothetical protein